MWHLVAAFALLALLCFTLLRFTLLCLALLCFSRAEQSKATLHVTPCCFAFALLCFCFCFALLCVAFAFLCSALLQQGKATLHVTPCCFSRCFALLCSALLSSALLQQSGAKQSNVLPQSGILKELKQDHSDLVPLPLMRNTSAFWEASVCETVQGSRKINVIWVLCRCFESSI